MESTRFLDDEDCPEKATHDGIEYARRKHSHEAWMLHGFIITIYSIIFLLATLRNRHTTTNHDAVHNMIQSPATVSISYGTKYFKDSAASAMKYFGEPSDEREAAWEELLARTDSTIRLHPEDIARLGRPRGIQLPDGDYIGTMTVFHDLHCLRRVTRLLYADHYFPNMTDEIKNLNLKHARHSLDRIRQSVQCRGDVSLGTFIWGKEQAIPIANFTSLHECVNWDAIYRWSRDRRVDVFEPGLLIHPTLGPAYTNLDNMTFTGTGNDTALE